MIPCPHCGPRAAHEFACRGDGDNAADRPRPGSDVADVWAPHVYDRRNPDGDSIEVWQHVGGCRALMRVQRDTRTHAVGAVVLLGPAAAADREAEP